MSLYLIKGQYRIAHWEPGGDSIYFIPGNSGAFTGFGKEITDPIFTEGWAGRQAAASARSASRLTRAA
jgi:hypothetical protein